MALHRDIFWIGRQWAVTGFGVQAVNQKHSGQFDIAIDRLWDDDLLDSVREQKWFNPDDFNKGLEIARARHPRPPARPAPPLPAERPPPATVTGSPVKTVPLPGVAAVELPKTPAPSFLPMSIHGHPARLLRIWRVRRRH